MIEHLTQKPWVLAPIKGRGSNDGYSLNIHQLAASGGGLGSRVCHIPPFTWRSESAVMELGLRISALPVMEEALLAIANHTSSSMSLAELGMRAFAREALIAGGHKHKILEMQP